jgi:hypothetical protein
VLEVFSGFIDSELAESGLRSACLMERVTVGLARGGVVLAFGWASALFVFVYIQFLSFLING